MSSSNSSSEVTDGTTNGSRSSVRSYIEPWVDLFVPGRICLFGEHTDWAGQFRRFNSDIACGCTVVSGTNQGIHAQARKHNSSLIVHTILPSSLNPDAILREKATHGYEVYITSSDGVNKATLNAPMNFDVLKSIAGEGGFFSYAAGVAFKVLQDYKVTGVEIDCYECNLPVAKGLSSSAAVCVLVARSFNRIFNLRGTTRFEMEYAYRGENLTPSRCGRMDQACAFGSRPVVMNYDADDLDCKEISVGKALHYLIVDLAYPGKSTTEILQGLQSAYPFPQNEQEKNAHTLFGETNLDIVSRAMDALKEGDAATLGSLMWEAQDEFDKHAKPLCPSQLTMPILYSLIKHPFLQPLIHGAKGVGSQGDGTAQLLCKSDKSREEAMNVIKEHFPNMSSLPLTLEPTGKVQKAVVLAAGFSHSHYPVTASTSVSLFPIVSENISKPAVLLHVEQLDEAGVEEIGIVVMKTDVQAMANLFHNKLEEQKYRKLNEAQKAYARKLSRLGLKVKIIVQDLQEGMGHAVLTAEDFVKEEPFMLVIAHHLMSSSLAGKNCFEQTLDAFDNGGGVDTLAVRTVSGKYTSSYGVVACGEGWGDGMERIRKVTGIAEKPSPSFASANLVTPGLEEGNFLSVFGIFILKPHIFPIIKNMIKTNSRGSGGMFSLTDALKIAQKHYDMIAIQVEGKRWDLTNPSRYAAAVAHFSK